MIIDKTISEGLAGERVLLVGGAGFIGHNLALALREQGVETMVFDNLMVNSLIANLYDLLNTYLNQNRYLS